MKPRVSIGLPVYNGERYIAEALESIVSQTFTDFELIISDNASTDATLKICESYAARDGRIVLYPNEKNRGAAWNYNHVFALSRGEYFKWASHDDRCAPPFLERCVDALDAHPAVVVAYPRTTVIDADGGTIEMEEDDLQLDSPDVVGRFTTCLSPMKLCHNVVFGLMRRAVLEQTNLIGAYLASDRCLVAEMSLYGPFEEIPERLFFRRKHGANIGVALEDLQFYRPGDRRRFVMPEWRLLVEFLKLARMPRLPATTRVRLAAAVLRWAARYRREFSWQLKAMVKGVLGIAGKGDRRSGGPAGRPGDRRTIQVWKNIAKTVELGCDSSNDEEARIGDLVDIAPKGRSSVLDIGARDGRVSVALAPYFESVTALDLVTPEIRHPKVSCVQGDVTGLRFPDDSFDVVVCAELLEHIRPGMLGKAAAEIVRVASCDVVIGVPYKQDLRIGRTVCRSCGKRNPPWGHVNVFDEDTLTDLFGALEPVATSFIGADGGKTNALSVFLMDLAGNPWGTYNQQEACIHCGSALLTPPPMRCRQRILSSTALLLNALQSALCAPRPNWIHMVFRKRPFEAGSGTE